MLTADVINVLRNHPWTVGMLPQRPGAKRFWVNGARDARNSSVRANGVNSNATGARADDVDFDDIEVPGNVETPEARLKLRQRISESTHIAVPGSLTIRGITRTEELRCSITGRELLGDATLSRRAYNVGVPRGLRRLDPLFVVIGDDVRISIRVAL